MARQCFLTLIDNWFDIASRKAWLEWNCYYEKTDLNPIMYKSMKQLLLEWAWEYHHPPPATWAMERAFDVFTENVGPVCGGGVHFWDLGDKYVILGNLCKNLDDSEALYQEKYYWYY